MGLQEIKEREGRTAGDPSSVPLRHVSLCSDIRGSGADRCKAFSPTLRSNVADQGCRFDSVHAPSLGIEAAASFAVQARRTIPHKDRGSPGKPTCRVRLVPATDAGSESDGTSRRPARMRPSIFVESFSPLIDCMSRVW